MPVHSIHCILKSAKFNFKFILISCIVISSTAQCCRYDGRTRTNGETWISGNFLMKCTTEENGAWKVDVVACVLDDGSRLELNDHKPVGNDEFSCAVAPDGSVSLRQMVNANAGCGTHPVGDVWREGNFEFECQRRGQQILRACITDCNLRIKAGEQISADGQEIKCEQLPDGTVWMHGTIKQRIQMQLSCIDQNGNRRPAGSQWRENVHFEVQCSKEGRLQVLHCVAKDGTVVPLNQSVRNNGFVYKCQQVTSRDYHFTYESENFCCS